MADLVGKTIDRYRVVARLGRGGMAEVYKAYQPALQRYVAIKVMLSYMVDDKEFVDRFEREALNTSKLRHPNIVQAIDFAHEGGTYFIVMEFIDGPTLKEELKARRAANKPFTLKEVAIIFTALCNAIDHAHRRGMVHRDIKPANVMINQEGQIVLTDFGIVRTVDGTQHTATGALTGTPAYMSPEQGRGERADERSDIYALGVMLYEMVTGTVPYDADTPFAIIIKHMSEPLPLPTKVNPDIPPAVEEVIIKAMAKNPDDRFQSAGALAKALREGVGLAPGEENKPITIVAPRPKTQDIEHATGPITPEEKTAAGTVLSKGEAATVLSSNAAGSTVAAQPARGWPVVPIVIGGIIIAALLGAALLLFSGLGGDDVEATAVAEQAATATGQAEATAAAAVNIPTAPLAPTDTPTPIPPGTPQAVAVTELEVRAGPGDDYPLLGYLPGGATVEITSRDKEGTWWQIKTSLTASGVGWIRAGEEFSTSTDTVSVPIALAPPTPTLPVAVATEEEETPTPEPTEPAATATAAQPVEPPTSTPPPNTPTPAEPTDTPTPERPAIAGKLAFPVDNGSGAYDVYIASLPDGDIIGTIRGARQPNFRLDGQKLLVNGQGGSFGENVYEASSTGNIERGVSGSPSDLHPFYKPDGTTLTYGNPQLAFGSEGYQPYIFVQCSLIPPNEDKDNCADIAGSGILVPAGLIGDIIGSNPVWTGSDQIAFKGCNTWGGGGGGSCGIFLVGSWATKRTSNGENPRKLVDGGNVIPTDAKAGLIAFHSRESGNWEAYVVSEAGGAPINISNGPNSSDGLPTISPDGKWVAFASDREGAWGVYVAPATGGDATKLFDFPKANPWGTGERDWTNERISWGP